MKQEIIWLSFWQKRNFRREFVLSHNFDQPKDSFYTKDYSAFWREASQMYFPPIVNERGYVVLLDTNVGKKYEISMFL